MKWARGKRPAGFERPLAPALRTFGVELSPAGATVERARAVADSLAVGCVLAGAGDWLRSRSLYARAIDSKLFAVVPFVVLGAALFGDRPRLNFFFGLTIMNLGIAACIEWCVRHHEGRIGRALNSKPIVFVGAMSYSIYLWQQLFLDRESTSVVASFPLNVALASYVVVERPSLALRRFVERARRPQEDEPQKTQMARMNVEQKV